MKTIFNRIKGMKIGKHTLLFLIMLLVGAGMYFLLMYVIGPYEPMSRFPAAVLTMALAVSAWIYFDDIHFSEINTIHEIRKGNVAYAIVLLAIAILIASVIVSV